MTVTSEFRDFRPLFKTRFPRQPPFWRTAVACFTENIPPFCFPFGRALSFMMVPDFKTTFSVYAGNREDSDRIVVRVDRKNNSAKP